ncbi:MAG TPA: hypothetical protein VIN03_09700 [Roseateles sp.]
MTFKKAELTELNAQNQTVGEAVAVQFNPATLRIQFSNRSASGGGAGAPARQRAGEGSTTVSFDLHFDTADEGSAGAPLSVLTKTSQVERFVRPRGTAPGQEAPPRVQFEWGGIKVQGVMESCSLDLELFADDGTPLRARCGVQIKGQDPSYALAPSGAGLGGLAAGLANAAGGLVPPALSPTQSGLPMPASPDLGQLLRALQGESLPQLAARAGQDPKAWRDLGSGGATNPQKLPAGQQVGVPASPGSAPGSGVQAGALGETASRTAPAAGAAPDASAASAGTSADRLTPKALTRAGGLVAAQSQARSTAHTAQARQRLAGFATTASGAAATGDDRPYGFGLPLKPRRGFVSADTPRPATRRLRCSCSGACGCKH